MKSLATLLIFCLISIQCRKAVSADAQPSEIVAKWCTDVQHELTHVLKWRQKVCEKVEWKSHSKSVEGRPLVFAEFGNPKSANVTLVLAMVHSDEITPLFIGIELATYFAEKKLDLTDSRVIIAPLVNPDGFFKKPRTRVNARGVDVNRNLNTKDWKVSALDRWKKNYRSDPRRFPGNTAASEPETQFQEKLIGEFKPQKILSIHAPLNHTDYDGPSPLELNRFSKDYVQECIKLRAKLKAVSTGFFPGSLGNFAGQELGIPTVTLELPTANPRKARVYWNRFRPGIEIMINFKMPDDAAVTSAAKSLFKR